MDSIAAVGVGDAAEGVGENNSARLLPRSSRRAGSFSKAPVEEPSHNSPQGASVKGHCLDRRTPASTATAAAAACTRNAQRSSTRVALRRSAMLVSSRTVPITTTAKAEATPAAANGGRYGSARSGAAVEEGPKMTTGRRDRRGARQQAGVALALPRRTSPRLSGEDTHFSMKDADNNLIKVINANKRKSVGGAGAAKSTSAKKRRASTQQQTREQRSEPNPAVDVGRGGDDYGPSGMATCESLNAGPKLGDVEGVVLAKLSSSSPTLASTCTAPFPEIGDDHHQMAKSLATPAAAIGTAESARLLPGTIFPPKAGAADGGDGGQPLIGTLSAAPLSPVTGAGKRSMDKGSHCEDDAGTVVEGGAADDVGGVDVVVKAPSSGCAEALKQVLSQPLRGDGTQQVRGATGGSSGVGAGMTAKDAAVMSTIEQKKSRGETSASGAVVVVRPVSAVVAAAAAAAYAAASSGGGQLDGANDMAQPAQGDSEPSSRTNFSGWHTSSKEQNGSGCGEDGQEKTPMVNVHQSDVVSSLEVAAVDPGSKEIAMNGSGGADGILREGCSSEIEEGAERKDPEQLEPDKQGAPRPEQEAAKHPPPMETSAGGERTAGSNGSGSLSGSNKIEWKTPATYAEARNKPMVTGGSATDYVARATAEVTGANSDRRSRGFGRGSLEKGRRCSTRSTRVVSNGAASLKTQSSRGGQSIAKPPAELAPSMMSGVGLTPGSVDSRPRATEEMAHTDPGDPGGQRDDAHSGEAGGTKAQVQRRGFKDSGGRHSAVEGQASASVAVGRGASNSGSSCVPPPKNEKDIGAKAGRRNKAKRPENKRVAKAPSRRIIGGVDLKFLKPKEAHGVPLTPTPRFYLPAEQGGFRQGDGADGLRFRPASSEGGADVVWDRRRFKFSLLLDEEVGVDSGGCCGGAETADVAAMAESERMSTKAVSISTTIPSSHPDGSPGGVEKEQVRADFLPPPPSSPPGKSRTPTLKDTQDQIFETLSNKNRQKDLITPQGYGHAGGYFGESEQPFRVVVHPNVHFVADAHSYMMENNEVIGWLGGWFDDANKILYVQAAVPCREDQEASGGHRGRTEVSMCHSSSLDASEAIRGRRFQLVGWYHSHPKFVNDPSPIDVENHQLFQREEKEEGSSGAWVGLIVGRKTSPSDFRWFRNAVVERVVRGVQGEPLRTETVLCPMLLRTSLASSVISSAAAAAKSTSAAAAAATSDGVAEPAAAATATATAATPVADTEPVTATSNATTLPTSMPPIPPLHPAPCARDTEAAGNLPVGTAAIVAMEPEAGTREGGGSEQQCPNPDSAGRVPVPEGMGGLIGLRASGEISGEGVAAGGGEAFADGGVGNAAVGAGDVSLPHLQQLLQQRKRRRTALREQVAAVATDRRRGKTARTTIGNYEAPNASSAASAADANGGVVGDEGIGRADPPAAIPPRSNNGCSNGCFFHVPTTRTSSADGDGGCPRVGGAGNDAPFTGELAAAAREAIVAIARNPPLVMSEEALEVLKGYMGDRSLGGGGDGVGGYGSKLDRVVESLTSLGRYYSGKSGRAPLSNGAQTGIPILEKLARSLAQTVQHMELHPCEAGEFIQDTCFFLLACFRETDVKIANQQRGVTKKRKGRAGAGSTTSPRRSSRNPLEAGE